MGLVNMAIRTEDFDLVSETYKSEKYQLKILKKVVDIVAAQTPADSVRMIPKLNHEVKNFILGNKKFILK